jgi:Zn-dependent peptidase ImmA (M78 family)
MIGMAEVSMPKVKACRILRDLRIEEPGELSMEDIAWTRGAVVVENGLRGADARLIYTPGVRPAIIRVNATIPQIGRRRFAIAHELGHMELNHSPGAPTECGEREFVLWYRSQNKSEVEANTFAAELLLPEVMFRKKLERTLPSWELIEQLAEEFNATLTATAIRYIDICEEPCAVVFSTHGKVLWTRKSKDFSGWIVPGQQLSHNCLAIDFFKKGNVSTKMETMRRDAWIENASERQAIREQARAMPSYDSVLSLLWIPYEFSR